jgi:hypothetical protein
MRPLRGSTPLAYSFAAKEVAATTRRATVSESSLWAADPAAHKVLNAKLTNRLR